MTPFGYDRIGLELILSQQGYPSDNPAVDRTIIGYAIAEYLVNHAALLSSQLGSVCQSLGGRKVDQQVTLASKVLREGNVTYMFLGEAIALACGVKNAQISVQDGSQNQVAARATGSVFYVDQDSMLNYIRDNFQKVKTVITFEFKPLGE